MVIKYSQSNGLKIQGKTGQVLLGDRTISIKADEEQQDGNSKSEFIVTSPGEFEVAGIAVFSYAPFPSFLIEVDQINVVYLPSPPEESYASAVKDELERVDVLIVPGKRNDLVTHLAPYLVIPLDDMALIAEKMSTDLPEEVKSLNLRTRADLPEETELVNLAS